MAEAGRGDFTDSSILLNDETYVEIKKVSDNELYAIISNGHRLYAFQIEGMLEIDEKTYNVGIGVKLLINNPKTSGNIASDIEGPATLTYYPKTGRIEWNYYGDYGEWYKVEFKK